MRILFLTHRPPFPPNKGDKIRSFNILTHLASRHDVYVASLIDDATDLKHAGQIRDVARAYLYERIDSPGRRLVALRAMAHGRPITVDYFYSRQLQTAIDAMLDKLDVDVVLCYSSPMADYVFRSRHAHGKLARAAKLMDLIDVDSYKWVQYAEAAPFWKAWIYRYEARTLAAYERRIARDFDRLFLVSEQERSYFPGGPVEHLHAFSNGVDLTYFSPNYTSRQRPAAPALVFTGVMDYWPNVEGVKWFARDIFPRIQASVPDVRLYVVGSRPTAEVRNLASDSIIVTGFTEDVRDYLAGASVCIVPLRIARGVQNKILEAMAMAKPVITTPQAFEGLQATPGEDIVVAHNEDGFAAAAIELLRDRERARRVGERARHCVERHYSWSDRLALLETWMSRRQ